PDAQLRDIRAGRTDPYSIAARDAVDRADRNRAEESVKLARDQSPDGQNRLRPAKDNRGGGDAEADRLGQNGGGRGRAAAAGHDQNASGDILAAIRMRAV